jgi:hypothetical protein
MCGIAARSEADVSAAIHAVRQCLPFPLLGLDTDNGGEFINYELLRYFCRMLTPEFGDSRVRNSMPCCMWAAENKGRSESLPHQGEPVMMPSVHVLFAGTRL